MSRKRLLFLYLLWLSGFVISNVLWGAWVVLVFWSDLRDEDEGIILGVDDDREVASEHVRWMTWSAMIFVAALPCFFVLSRLSLSWFIYVPYAWFFYRWLVGIFCLFLRKKPSSLLSIFFAGKKKRSSSYLIIR